MRCGNPSFVYVITNKLNGDTYVGASKGDLHRLDDHKKGKNSNQYLHNAIIKYGVENFTFNEHEMLSSWEEALCAERKYNQYLRSIGVKLYNCTDGGAGVINPSEETLQKMRTSHLRRIDPSHPDAQGKQCVICTVLFFPRQSLTQCTLDDFIVQCHCSRLCALIHHNKQQKGIPVPTERKRRISRTMTRLKIDSKHLWHKRRLDPSHLDTQVKQCERCNCAFLPKCPLTPANVARHKRKRFCNRICARNHHNELQHQKSIMR